MAEYSKEKLFYLKLNKEFFDQHYIKILETQGNGDKYILFLVKLMCESISHNGYLRFNESIPYDEKMLAAITRTNIDIVRVAIKLFESMGIIEFTKDKTLFIPVVQLLTCSTTEGAVKKQKQRDRAITIRTNGGQMSTQEVEQTTNQNLDETRKEKVVHMSSKEEHMSTRDKSLEIRDKSIKIKDNNITNERTPTPYGDKIDFLDNYSNNLIKKALSRNDFDTDKLNEWLEDADIKSKDNPSAWFTKVFPAELEKGTFNKIVKPKTPNNAGLPSWEEMIDDLNPTEDNDSNNDDLPSWEEIFRKIREG